MDDALDGHRAVGRHVFGRALQQRLQRGFQLVDGVDIEHGVHRRTGPLDRRAVFDDELLVDDVLEREKEAPFGDGIVAVHLEDVRARIDLQVERSVAAALERIARHAQLDLDAGTDVERQRDVHLAAGDGLLLAPAFEHHLPARQIIDRVGLGLLLEGHEIGVRDIGFVRQRHEERRMVVGGGGDVHIDGALVARNARRARSVDLAVEEIVVLRRGVEHQHLLGCDTHVVGDVGEVLQAQVDVEAAPVAFGVEDRNVRRAEAVAPHVEHGFGHRIGHLRKIDLRRESPNVNPACQVGVPALAL